MSSSTLNETGATAIDMLLSAAALTILSRALLPSSTAHAISTANVPAQAQVIDQASFAVLPNVPPPSEVDGFTVRIPSITSDTSRFRYEDE